MFRIWLFISSLLAFAAVAISAWGAHGANDLASNAHLASIFGTAQQFHITHAIALFGSAVLMSATDECRNLWGTVTLNLAAIFFLAGIVLFSGGIYYQVVSSGPAGPGIVPAGGMAFMAGWVILALSVFGYRRS